MGAQSDAIGRSLTAVTEDVVRMLVLEIAANLRASPDAGGTPVDTGHARANWVPSVGAPFGEVVSDGGAYEAGAAAVLAYHLDSGAAWVANNVPYINLLDLGFSSQAAAGFVEVAIFTGVLAVERRLSGVDLGSANLARYVAAAAEGDNF